MWLFQLVMRKPARDELSARIVPKTSSLKLEKAKRKKGRLPKYCEVVQYLIRTYESDDIISQEEFDLVNLRQSSNMEDETYA